MSNVADDDVPPLSPDEEAEMQAEIELALDPYRKLAPPKLLAQMRAELERGIRTHPDPRRYLRAFATRKNVIASGDGPIDGSQPGGELKGQRGKDGA